jgi:hypothetical protein
MVKIKYEPMFRNIWLACFEISDSHIVAGSEGEDGMKPQAGDQSRVSIKSCRAATG